MIELTRESATGKSIQLITEREHNVTGARWMLDAGILIDEAATAAV
jgi:hypothetical protein